MDSSQVYQAVSDRVTLLFSEIFEHAKGGHHKLSTSKDFDVSSLRFAVRPSDGFVYCEEEDLSPEELQAVVLRIILEQEYATLGLVSLLPEGITEIRGWLVEPDEIKPLSPEDLLEACVTDFETGRFRSPDPNTRYCDTWK